MILINPKYLKEEKLFMIEQWILSGGSTLIFLDPYAETEVGMNPGMPALNPRSDLKKLIDIWNIDQKNTELYPKLKGPDYIFKNDFNERIKYLDIFSKNKLSGFNINV